MDDSDGNITLKKDMKSYLITLKNLHRAGALLGE